MIKAEFCFLILKTKTKMIILTKMVEKVKSRDENETLSRTEVSNIFMVGFSDNRS